MQDPITMRWAGWTDDLSGLWEYYVEVFKLSPDPFKRLTEMTPINPVFSSLMNHSLSIIYPTFQPSESGMYR